MSVGTQHNYLPACNASLLKLHYATESNNGPKAPCCNLATTTVWAGVWICCLDFGTWYYVLDSLPGSGFIPLAPHIDVSNIPMKNPYLTWHLVSSINGGTLLNKQPNDFRIVMHCSRYQSSFAFLNHSEWKRKSCSVSSIQHCICRNVHIIGCIFNFSIVRLLKIDTCSCPSSLLYTQLGNDWPLVSFGENIWIFFWGGGVGYLFLSP